jgi:hypothetical protein
MNREMHGSETLSEESGRASEIIHKPASNWRAIEVWSVLGWVWGRFNLAV